jgi:hypothetical protein
MGPYRSALTPAPPDRRPGVRGVRTVPGSDRSADRVDRTGTPARDTQALPESALVLLVASPLGVDTLRLARFLDAQDGTGA